MKQAAVGDSRASFLTPTLTKQSISFMIGGSLFAAGAAASIWDITGATATNWMFFIGAWFFTTAGFMQVLLSGDATVPSPGGRGKTPRAEWLAAATQSLGTLLFNVSTTTALTARSVADEKHFMWNPDAGGSFAFLVSAFFVYVAFYRETGTLWKPAASSWWSAHINMVGCLAFAVSAVGAYVLDDGSSKDADLSNWGTFIGAICFVLASAVVLPQLPWNRSAETVASLDGASR